MVFDIQDRIGRLALDMALDWLCGETPSASSSSAAGRGREWEAAKDGIGEAMKEAQRVVGKRVKIGTPWVSLRVAPYIARAGALTGAAGR